MEMLTSEIDIHAGVGVLTTVWLKLTGVAVEFDGPAEIIQDDSGGHK